MAIACAHVCPLQKACGHASLQPRRNALTLCAGGLADVIRGRRLLPRSPFRDRGIVSESLILRFLVYKMEKVVAMRVTLDQSWKLLEQCLVPTQHSKFIIPLLLIVVVVAPWRFCEAKWGKIRRSRESTHRTRAHSTLAGG